MKSLQKQLDESEQQLIDVHSNSSKEDEELKRQVIALQRELENSRRNINSATSSLNITKQEAAQLVITLEDDKKVLTQQVQMLKLQLNQERERANEIEENTKQQMNLIIDDKDKKIDNMKQVYIIII